MNEQTIEQVTNDFNAKTKEHASEAVKILDSLITEEDEKIIESTEELKEALKHIRTFLQNGFLSETVSQ